MELLKLIILSIIQGITEILPISSSGHLILFKHLLNLEYDGLTFEIFLHLGSLIAILIYYFNDIKDIIKKAYKYIFYRNQNYKNEFKLLINLFISTLCTGCIALLIKDYIELYLSSIFYLPLFFLVTSLLLYLSKYFKQERVVNDMNMKDSIKIGLFQLIGVIPGISRSGITFFSTKLCKLKDEDGFRYTFFLFIPIAFASFITEIPSISNLSFPPYYYIIMVIVTLIFTLFSLIFFKKLIKSNKLHYFSFYLLLMSLITIVLTIN